MGRLPMLSFLWGVTHNIPSFQQQKCSYTYVLREAHWRLSLHGFLFGATHTGILCLSTIIYQTPRRKTSIHQKSHCLHKFRHSELAFSVGIEGNILKFKFPDASQIPTQQAGSSEESSLRPATLMLFCTVYLVRSAKAFSLVFIPSVLLWAFLPLR